MAATTPPTITPEEPETQQGRSIQPKTKKPTVSQNAQAIETLSQKITGVDAQLSTMNSLLAQLAANKNGDVSNPVPYVNPAAQIVSQPQTWDHQLSVNHTVTPHYDLQSQPHASAAYAPGMTSLTPAAPPAFAGRQNNTAPYPVGTSAGPRARHYTTPAAQPLPYPPTPGWTARAPAAAVGGYAGAHHHTLTTMTQPWDHPTTLQDLETDPALTRRVVEAISAVATPFTGISGKHAQFPHHLVTRGSKKQKTNLGELSMAEYTWGFLQIVKARDLSDDSIPFMNAHLENVLEDAMMYHWADVRKWSEEVCTRISKGTLRWTDTYIIDRLQTQLSHKNLLSHTQTQGGATSDRLDAFELSEVVRQAKPGPPCKHFQSGSCTHTTDHVQKGYRQLHVCSYCLANKCLLQPHSLKDCKTKKFNFQKKAQAEPGFGS